ncbi:hypothetical protein BD324DRAFT_680086 [Kockovaella imperatae]|uniref:Uncharacterized protein n=1 Tax=Kockovaella imperatae TaxID=4999 RepID=A0A1Y1UJV6_9TREE|nr:hypothetical protein BD324DRAFT_680086 [Kockovaella imperatae]ORX38341.1 hypothetical protein BD324DRAFT_680086 [Kockovaella imperatae]
MEVSAIHNPTRHRRFGSFGEKIARGFKGSSSHKRQSLDGSLAAFPAPPGRIVSPPGRGLQDFKWDTEKPLPPPPLEVAVEPLATSPRTLPNSSPAEERHDQSKTDSKPLPVPVEDAEEPDGGEPKATESPIIHGSKVPSSHDSGFKSTVAGPSYFDFSSQMQSLGPSAGESSRSTDVPEPPKRQESEHSGSSLILTSDTHLPSEADSAKPQYLEATFLLNHQVPIPPPSIPLPTAPKISPPDLGTPSLAARDLAEIPDEPVPLMHQPEPAALDESPTIPSDPIEADRSIPFQQLPNAPQVSVKDASAPSFFEPAAILGQSTGHRGETDS